MEEKKLIKSNTLSGKNGPDSNQFTLSYYFLEPLMDFFPCGIILLKISKDEKENLEIKYFVQNKIAAELTGLSTDKVINKNIKKFPGIFPAYILSNFQNVIEKGHFFKGEIEIYNGNKKNIIELICSRYPDGLIVILNDLTKIKALVNQQKKLESDLFTVLSIAGVGSFEFLFQNQALQCSDEIFNIFEIQKSQDLNIKKLKKLIHQDDKKKVNKFLDDILQNIPPFNCEFRILVKNGIEKVVHCKLKIFFDEAGNPERIFGALTDKTKQKRLEKELLLKNDELSLAYKKGEEIKMQLEKLNLSLNKEILNQTKQLTDKNQELMKVNKELDNFVYTASHDLKAPISNIEGLLNALVSDLNSESTEAGHIIELLNLSINKFKTTLHDLSQIALVQNPEDEDQDVDLNALFEDIKFSIHEEILKYEATVEADFSKISEIKFSRNSLRSILKNLILNGLKYSSPYRRPEIFLSTHRENGYIIILVRDNGLGIKKEDLEKIFSVFTRIYTHVSGTGVGLFIVKRIVENNEGKIEVESEINKGSTFRIYLKNKIK